MFLKKRHLGRWLQQQFDHLPPKTRMALAISCLLCSMALSVLSMLPAFQHPIQPGIFKPIKMPAHLLPPNPTPIPTPTPTPAEIYSHNY